MKYAVITAVDSLKTHKIPELKFPLKNSGNCLVIDQEFSTSLQS